VKRAVLTLSTALLLLTCAAPAQAARKPIVGFGEQNALFFSDPRWMDMDKNEGRYVRYVMPWDSLRRLKTRTTVDIWMTEAEARGADVMVTFGHSVRRGRELRLPTRAQYRAEIKAFRKRYPFVKTFQAWNEANHGTQPTARKPTSTGKLYDVLVKTCRGCTITAPSILLAGEKEMRWLQAFDRAAKSRVKIWAVHNHIDANRNTQAGTKLFLRTFRRGQVWFSETGAIWDRWVPKKSGRKKHITRYNRRSAVRAVRNIFKLQRIAPRRITRIYYYNWFSPGVRKPQWDSGLIDVKNGKARPTLSTLKAQMRKYAR
jgi:polysaccharide biosynthesis protein PslG